MSDTMELEGLIKGNITKKPEPGAPDYRKAWIANVNKYNDKVKPHPFCHGIQMDTHHLISGKALSDIDKDMQDALIDKGYNINSLSNLVGLPSSYKGACHLGIQVHRTQHTFGSNQFSETKASNYHDEVIDYLLDIAEDIYLCNGTTEVVESKRDIHDKHMDPISEKLLKRVLNFSLPLTKISEHFNKENKPYIGCANKGKIGELSKSITPCENKKNDHSGEWDEFKSYTPEVQISFGTSWSPKREI
ncbi:MULTISPECIES: AHH domain-containing protein [Vibrio]|uniref:AHH domain-containing protein n=1 Tax=Vibrio TaxID=662 RepID=UPI002075B733|nr:MULTISPECIES: AHH domain-containing protein [Vibrio]USD32591.1 AHH domain-containing protein [Vibrio sp. SCSIO 43186]USD45632.1 AHH domain-containing protein [Vibrio sp. SCSIO 43145]USD69716.1 AHH domain-containing protein [Vibrio sp. SCSIO 43139]USD94623.1 hypothetical protein CTT30_00165 [Vibrio coralliilyticus]